MNLPNLLTLLRLLLIPCYLWAFYGVESPHKILALSVLLFAGLTDVLDGYLARTYKLETYTGQLLDPLADKLMMVSVLFTLLTSGRLPWVVAALLVFRDLAMIAGAAFFYFQGKRAVPKANWWGKITTCFYYIGISFCILAWPTPTAGEMVLWFTVGLSYVTTVIYVRSMKIIPVRRRVY
ncbi:CDP-diacylglycerol--glycerol-3-phosphate 3-phosphatidyltransferase [Alicyclobacillus sendaiensis]|uniref:CDP-diacylglycerol--glycerol-3-phosphate 3-phosphatidyltransferase n=1 Tax=Alicyclobacillus sendaiensis PA2 TaxID=3029425 RepID=A0ABT6XUV3_ALISE|nr:CDP-diacylglycerol--glycerol-3-phosphate 3-phosphatidyltransferase [Alicyclobacillus sendaiensis]MDI9258841.1 CDP-diacylglycerol--glycerol-3-phosphate 3-phosphatidyltransferase [Alicyclobacillus sendaiensis PA2]